MRPFALLLSLILMHSAATAAEPQQASAVFAGGCFWCMESEFSELGGVSKVTSGYTGGHVKNPSYEDVSSGTTGHVEAVEVTYDPQKITYSKLLDIFWGNVDPTDEYGQFCDKGSQYHAGIFYRNEEQKKLAEASLAAVEAKLHQKVATFIKPASDFYPAEVHHQGYYRTNKMHYQLYRMGCGRDARLKEIWQK